MQDGNKNLDSTMMINLNASKNGRFKLSFLGTGSAFTIGEGNYQSNMLLEDLDSNKKLLIDCGTDIRFSLHEAGLKISDITDIYCSHPHADHIGGLECAAFMTKWIPGREKTNLYISRRFSTDLWTRSLSGGLESIEGQIASIDDYFNVEAIGQKGRFDWQGINFQLVQVVHIMNGFEFVPSYGLLFKINGVMVFFTSDTQFAPHQLVHFYDKADVIFHDCETSPFKSGVHAHYSELRELDPKTKRKMWLYHYQPGKTQDAVADGFSGFAVKGQKFDFL
jgi:ribonuclease BN (tRNA processing enzyme)